MTRLIKVNGLDIAGLGVRLDSLSLTTSAWRGEPGVGSMTVEDPTGRLVLESWQTCNVDESASTGRFYTGYTANRKFSRGKLKGAFGRTIEVDLVDLNHLLDQELGRGQDWIRPDETDYARIEWLANTTEYQRFLAGGTYWNPNTNTVMMDATDYRDSTGLTVLRECSEASGKNFWLSYYPGTTYILWYDLSTNDFNNATYRISDYIQDQGLKGEDFGSNPGFESSTTGYTVAASIMGAGDSITRDTSDAYMGVGCGKVDTKVVSQSGVSYPLTGSFLTTKSYRFGVWLKRVSGASNLIIKLGSIGTALNRATNQVTLTNPGGSLTGVWEYFSVDWTPSGGTTTDAAFGVGTNSAAEAIFFMDVAEVFQVNGTPTTDLTLYPIDPVRDFDASEVWSGVNVQFDKGSVFVENATTRTTYKRRELNITSDNRTSDGAENTANTFLSDTSSETVNLSCSILINDEDVYALTAGVRFLVRFTGLGMQTFSYHRATRVTVRPSGDPEKYFVSLEFTPKIKPSKPVRTKVHRTILADETIPNGGFEFGPKETDNRINDWNVVTGTARIWKVPNPTTSARPKPKQGIRGLRIEQAQACTVWTEDWAPVEASRQYLLTAYYMWNVTAAPGTLPSMKVAWYTETFALIGSASTYAFPPAAQSAWAKVSKLITSPATAAYRKVYVNCANSGTAGRYNFFDAISFERSDLTAAP